VNTRTADRVGDPLEAERRRQDALDIERYLAGEEAGFEQLWNRYRSLAYAVALSRTGNRDDAMEAAQKACIRVWRALPRFRRGEPFAPWLYRIVSNCAANLWRDERRHRGDVPLEFVPSADGRPSALDEVAGRDELERIWQALESLPPEQREVLVLHHFQGLKYREIAETVGIPIGTVMSRLHNARQRLRGVLGVEEVGG
jgi:RNA polymerase sigma-70 factor (ECF subfamily)